MVVKLVSIVVVATAASSATSCNGTNSSSSTGSNNKVIVGEVMVVKKYPSPSPHYLCDVNQVS